MDTNLKDNKLSKFTAATLGTLLIILLLTVISVAVYAPVKDSKLMGSTFNDNTKKYLESHSFNYTLIDLTHYLSQAKIQKNDYYYNPSYENLENIKYYLNNQNNNLTASNMDENSMEAEINDSQFYLHVKTDENGSPTIESAPNSFDKNAFIDGLRQFRKDTPDYLANLDIVYTVPTKLTGSNDLLLTSIKNYNFEKYIILILGIGAVSIFILTILAFAIPYSSQKQAAVVKLFNRMYLEFKFLTWIIFFSASFFILNLVAHLDYNQNFNYLDIITEANLYFYLIGIPATFVLYSLIYLGIVYIKYIYYTGFKEGFIKNSLLGKLSTHIYNSIKETVNQIIDVDITKDYNKKLLMLLGINLLALFMIALTGGLGLILALAYSILLFNYSLKILGKARELSEASSQLAKGNFDIVLPEDMGILSPFSKSLNNIKDGFKVAVDKEVKSQNMKTELISNVSHDLKTPLTSIITYVDLLKNEELEKEAQEEYIEVLDQKSKRLKVLIDDLFEVSKASSGNIELHLEQVDVIALLRQTLGEMEEKIGESTLQFKMNLTESKVLCILDGARTYRIFENIISNILKYAMPSTRVYIDLEESAKEAGLVFKNISNYEMNFDPSEIMERFTRGDKSRNTEGSGLGLTIAGSLTELQNGNLDIAIDGDLFKLTVTFPKA